MNRDIIKMRNTAVKKADEKRAAINKENSKYYHLNDKQDDTKNTTRKIHEVSIVE